jgi:hypothetical protein
MTICKLGSTCFGTHELVGLQVHLECYIEEPIDVICDMLVL